MMELCSGVRFAGMLGKPRRGEGLAGVGVLASWGEGPGCCGGWGEMVGEGWWDVGARECCEEGRDGGREGARGWRCGWSWVC